MKITIEIDLDKISVENRENIDYIKKVAENIRLIVKIIAEKLAKETGRWGLEEASRRGDEGEILNWCIHDLQEMVFKEE